MKKKSISSKIFLIVFCVVALITIWGCAIPNAVTFAYEVEKHSLLGPEIILGFVICGVGTIFLGFPVTIYLVITALMRNHDRQAKRNAVYNRISLLLIILTMIISLPLVYFPFGYVFKENFAIGLAIKIGVFVAFLIPSALYFISLYVPLDKKMAIKRLLTILATILNVLLIAAYSCHVAATNEGYPLRMIISIVIIVTTILGLVTCLTLNEKVIETNKQSKEDDEYSLDDILESKKNKSNKFLDFLDGNKNEEDDKIRY